MWTLALNFDLQCFFFGLFVCLFVCLFVSKPKLLFNSRSGQGFMAVSKQTLLLFYSVRSQLCSEYYYTQLFGVHHCLSVHCLYPGTFHILYIVTTLESVKFHENQSSRNLEWLSELWPVVSCFFQQQAACVAFCVWNTQEQYINCACLFVYMFTVFKFSQSNTSKQNK